MQTGVLLLLAIGLTVVVPAVALLRVAQSRRRAFGTPAQRAILDVLELVNRAAPPFRHGLTAAAGKATRDIRALLGVPAAALTDRLMVIGSDGPVGSHLAEVMTLADQVIAADRSHLMPLAPCGDADCELAAAVGVPLRVEGQAVGTVVAFCHEPGTPLIRSAEAVGGWLSSQLELSELDRSRAKLAEAELRALRAQISPHFVYNSLTTIAAFVRNDPERARELLLEFADFSRYSLSNPGQFVSLADELRAVDRYLELERARFGDRLSVRLQVAPEALSVAVPVFVIQPLVENAVRHGLAQEGGRGTVSLVVANVGNECLISVEDDGVGTDPNALRAKLSGRDARVGLLNVDERLRQVFGSQYGLVIETAAGAGTKVSLRVPRFRPGVRPSAPSAPSEATVA